VLLPSDVEGLARLVKERGLAEHEKSQDRTKLAGRIQLLHEVIATGVRVLSASKGG
jgi:hypothetical protein